MYDKGFSILPSSYFFFLDDMQQIDVLLSVEVVFGIRNQKSGIRDRNPNLNTRMNK